MSLTLANILDNVLLESGMGTETAYATSTKDEVLRLVKLANRTARMIATAYDWQALIRTYKFTLTTDTEYDRPSDIRAFIADTAYTDSNLSGIDMRTSPHLWRYLQVNSTGTGPRYRMRVFGDKIQVYQPQSGDEVSFEYLSDYPVMDTDGITAQKLFDADDDTWRLDDDLLTMGIILRYKKLLGLDWQTDLAEFRSYMKTVMGQQAPVKTIIGGDGSDYVAGEPYTPLYVNS